MVGGGMGRTHNKEQSFPKAAEHLGFVAKDDIFEAMKARRFSKWFCGGGHGYGCG